MAGDRLLVPIDDAYLHALGLALICFARLEWSAVWCCEKINPGYIQTVKRKTAGRIGNDLIAAAKDHADPAIVASLGAAAAKFGQLIERRNDLLHANPGTAPNGDQRLFRAGAEWTIAAVNDLADEFAAADRPLNLHFHHLL